MVRTKFVAQLRVHMLSDVTRIIFLHENIHVMHAVKIPEGDWIPSLKITQERRIGNVIDVHSFLDLRTLGLNCLKKALTVLCSVTKRKQKHELKRRPSAAKARRNVHSSSRRGMPLLPRPCPSL